MPWGDDFGVMLARCRELLALRRPIYEATFSGGGAFARADILDPVGMGLWDVVEVKSTTKVKDVHIPDLALQRYCYEEAGVPIRRCHLMHINNRYVRRGAVEAGRLFKSEDVTKAVAENLLGVGKRVAEMRQVIVRKTCPDVEIGPHCDNPYSCPLKPACWAKRWEADAAKVAAKPKVDVEFSPQAIREFLGGLVYPLHLLDFETFMTAIPLFDGTRPYQKVPFQFSLHVVDRPEAEPRHVSWLWDGNGDPRILMLEALRRGIGPQGTVLAYSLHFEKSRIVESARAFPEHASWVDELEGRMVDLAVPVRSHAIRHPSLGNKRWSLKLVLPLLTGKGYDDLAIRDGMTASAEFLRVTLADADPADRDAVRRNLEEYCGLDTRGMLDILGRLAEMQQVK